MVAASVVAERIEEGHEGPRVIKAGMPDVVAMNLGHWVPTTPCVPVAGQLGQGELGVAASDVKNVVGEVMH